MNFISRIIKSINAMRERLKIERHEAMYGPHFNEECALKAVSKNDLKNDVADIRKMIEDTKKMFMGGFPKPPMPPMPNVPAPMK